MKKDIHPEYHEATIRCACGAVYQTGSTRKDFSVEICSNCHPFFTGKQKLVDTAGRVERYQRRWGTSEGEKQEKEQEQNEEPAPEKTE